MKRNIIISVSLIFISAFISCSYLSGESKEETDNQQDVFVEETILPETEEQDVIEKTIDKDYIDFSNIDAAYVRDSKLYFYSIKEHQVYPFSKEKNQIFNCTFSEDGEALYYTVVINNMMHIRKLDFINKEMGISDVIALNKKEDDFRTKTYSVKSIFNMVNGNLILPFNSDWEYYWFNKYFEYSVESKTLKEHGISRYYEKYSDILQGGEEPYELVESLGEKAKKMDYFVHYPDPLDGFGEEIFFGGISKDKSKVYFVVSVGFGDSHHGPWIVSDIEGKRMKILKNTDIGKRIYPVWSGNNLFFLSTYTELSDHFETTNNKLQYVDKDTNEIIFVDIDVDAFTCKNH